MSVTYGPVAGASSTGDLRAENRNQRQGERRVDDDAQLDDGSKARDLVVLASDDEALEKRQTCWGPSQLEAGWRYLLRQATGEDPGPS